MELSFEQAVIEVWRQALVENAKTVELESARYPERGAGLLRTTVIQLLLFNTRFNSSSELSAV